MVVVTKDTLKKLFRSAVGTVVDGFTLVTNVGTLKNSTEALYVMIIQDQSGKEYRLPTIIEFSEPFDEIEGETLTLD